MPSDQTLPERRFYAGPERLDGDEVRLDPEETRHLARVLRLGPGARVGVFDGLGMELEAEVLTVAGEEARLRVVRRLPPLGESPLDLVLAIALAKAEAQDLAARQATEMGVKRIIPFICRRSENLDPNRMAARLNRWRRAARETLKSCRRSFLPEILAPAGFSGILAGPEELKVIFWEEERPGGGYSFKASAPPAGVRLLIGPEGGFTLKEVEQARAAGFKVASLGPRRLKVETAALAALTLVQHAFGDLG